MQQKIIKVDSLNKNLKKFQIKVNLKPKLNEKIKDLSTSGTGKSKILQRDKTPEVKNDSKRNKSLNNQHSTSLINRKENSTKVRNEINLFRTGAGNKSKPKENNSSFTKKNDTSVVLKRINTVNIKPLQNKNIILNQERNLTSVKSEVTLTKSSGSKNGRIIPDNKIASIRSKLAIKPTTDVSINKSFTIGSQNSTQCKERLIFGHKTNSQAKFNGNSNKSFLYFTRNNESSNSDIFDKTADFSSFKDNSNVNEIVPEANNEDKNIFLTLQNESIQNSNFEFVKLQKEIRDIIREQEPGMKVNNSSNCLITFRKEVETVKDENKTKRVLNVTGGNKSTKPRSIPLNFLKQNSSEALTTVSDSNRTQVKESNSGKIGAKTSNMKKNKSDQLKIIRSIKI